MESPRFVALLAIGAAAAVLTLAHAALGRDKKSLGYLLVVVLGLSTATLAPPGVRKFTFVALGVVIGLLSSTSDARIGIAIFLGGTLWVFERVIPGGLSAVIFLILAIIGSLRTRVAIAHLLRLRRARALQPGTANKQEVEIAGIVIGPDKKVPGLEERASAWRLGPANSGLLGIETEHGPVYVELRDATLLCETTQLSPKDRDALLSAHDQKPKPQMKQNSSDFGLEVFRENEPAYVIGLPQWEPHPFGGSGYRDAEQVPVFRRRSREGKGVYAANQSESEVLRQSWWTLSTWTLWGAVCLLVAILQYQGM